MEENINWNKELKQDLRKEAFNLYVKEQKNTYEIRNILVSKGLTQEEATLIAQGVEHLVEVEIRGKAKGQIGLGALLFALGCIITFVSYQNASAGGRYLFTYGLIIVGITNITRGAYALSKL